jgi:hypothetical protein
MFKVYNFSKILRVNSKKTDPPSLISDAALAAFASSTHLIEPFLRDYVATDLFLVVDRLRRSLLFTHLVLSEQVLFSAKFEYNF